MKYILYLFDKTKFNQSKLIWINVVSSTNKRFLSILPCVILKTNSDWAPPSPNQNQYTDRPLVEYDYYVAINCLLVVLKRNYSEYFIIWIDGIYFQSVNCCLHYNVTFCWFMFG